MAVTLTLFWLLAEGRGNQAGLVLPLMAASIASFVPVMMWKRVGWTVLRHPGYLVVEMVLTAYLLAEAGTRSPFFYFTLATALLAGALHSWRGAAGFSVLLVAAAWFAHQRGTGISPEVDDLQGLVLVPVLYPCFAVAGAALRQLLLRQAAQSAALAAAAQLSASAEERASLARDMHDSVAKTLHGIALSATALAETAGRRPESVPLAARRLASAARLAADEARSLIVGLRAGTGMDEPLSVAIGRVALAWGERAGITVDLAVQPVDVTCPVSSMEVVRILEEALTNVHRNAGAETVTVRLRPEGRYAVLNVVDDGSGFVVPERLDEFGATGHFGLIGASERAERVGGRLVVESVPGQGTTLTALIPLDQRRVVDVSDGEHVGAGSRG